MKKILALLFCVALLGMCVIGSLPVRAQDPQPTPFYGAGNPTPMGEGCYNGGQPPLCEDPPPANVAPAGLAGDSGNPSNQNNQSNQNSSVQATAVPAPTTQVCATTTVKVRSSPNGKKVGSLAWGKCLPLAGEKSDGFFPVSFNGGTAYISSSYSKVVVK